MFLNSIMLPGNIPGPLAETIIEESVNGTPVQLIIKNPPKLIDPNPSTTYTTETEGQEIDATNFPTLGGF